LVQNAETGTSLKLRVLNMTKRELGRDLSRAIEFDQSQLFKKIYENEFGTPGGEPYGALIGDYEWTNHPDDIETLRLMSNIAAGAFAPFISAAGAGMFGFDSWTELSKPRDLAKIFDTVEFAKWRAFRDSEDSRFVNLVMPRVIARLPYGKNTKPLDEFDYEQATAAAQTGHPGLPAALPLQEHGLRGVLRRPDGAEAEEVRSPRGDRQCGHLRPASLHHGDQPICPLPEGHGTRQDRQLHGSQQRRDLAQSLDPELR